MHDHVADTATTAPDTTDTTPVIALTETAAEMARAAMDREGATDAALRVGVVGGGCSGMQYTLGFDTTVGPDDTVIEQHGVRLVVDASSAPYLRGTTIDYVKGLHGAGFKFVNPNASRTCGCGSSFAAEG